MRVYIFFLKNMEEEQKDNFKFTDAEKEKNNNRLKHMIGLVPKIRPSMVRRLQRAKQETMCYFITEPWSKEDDNKQGQTQVAKIAKSKHEQTQVAKIAKSKHPIVSWLVPNPKDKSKPFQFCFSVKEVQDYIAEKCPPTHGDDPEYCPMFGRAQMQDIVGFDVDIVSEMPREFRFVFEEFHLLPYSQETLKEDTITKAALDAVEAYVEMQNAQHRDESDNSYVGSFWKFTKQHLKVAFANITDIGSKIMLYILGNPWWTSIVKMLAKILRVVFCTASSFANVTSNTLQIMTLLENQFKSTLGALSRGSSIIFELAKSILFQVFGFGERDVADDISKYRIVGTLENVINRAWERIKEACGFSFIMRLPKIVLQDSIDIFKRLFDTSKLQTLGDKLAQFNELDFAFLAMVLLFDTLSTCFENATKFVLFTFRFLPSNTENAAKLKKQLEEFAANTTTPFSWLRIIANGLQDETFHDVLQTALQELYFWIMDIFPCLFHYYLRNARAFLVFGISAPLDTNASCCLRDVVMSMQKEAVLYGNERGEGERAQAAIELASTATPQTQKKRTWLDYILRRPFSVDETLEHAAQTSKKEWEDVMIQDISATEEEEKKHEASTPSLVVDENDIGELWAAQCGHEDQHVFPNPVSVYKGKYPFFFENVYNNNNNQQHQLCVAPNAEHIQQKFPNAIWNFEGRNYVLLHKLPDDLVRHMATMKTPVFSFRAI